MSQPAISASTPAPFLRRAVTWLRRALRRRRTPDCGVGWPWSRVRLRLPAVASGAWSRPLVPARQTMPHKHAQRIRRLIIHPFPFAIADRPVEPRDLAIVVRTDEAIAVFCCASQPDQFYPTVSASSARRTPITYPARTTSTSRPRKSAASACTGDTVEGHIRSPKEVR